MYQKIFAQADSSVVKAAETVEAAAESLEAVAASGSDGGILDKFLETFTSMGDAAAAKTPYILIGLAIFVIGLIIAKIIRKTVKTVTGRIGLDSISEKVGIADLLSKIGIRKPLSIFLSSLLYYVLILFFIRMSAEFMGVSDLSKFIDNVIAFIPRLMVAFLILMAGLLAADLVRKMIEQNLDKIGLEYGSIIGKFAYGLLAVMILTVVLGQIGIETNLLNATVKIFLGAGSLAVALALGLGLRPIAKNVVSGVYARDTFPPGSVLQIGETEAVVVEVGPVSTRLETDDGDFFTIPNCNMVNQLLRGRQRKVESFEKNSL